MDYTNQHGALRQVGELDDNRQRLLAAKTELDDATKRYQDAKQAYDQAYTAFKPLCSRVVFPYVSLFSEAYDTALDLLVWSNLSTHSSRKGLSSEIVIGN